MASDKDSEMSYEEVKEEQPIKFLTSFTAKGTDGLSFNQKYPFVNAYASKLGLEVMTIEDLILLYASSDGFKKIALSKLNEILKEKDLRNIKVLKDEIEKYGIIGEAAYILGQAGHSCNIVKGKSREGRVKLTSLEEKFIHTLAQIVDGEKWKEILGREKININDFSSICDYYRKVFENPERYGLYLPGSARDLLKTTLFKDIFREYLTRKFITLCSRSGKSEIGNEYIEGIVENAISDVSNEYKNHIVVVVVNKETYEIVSFIGAENADEGRDIHGELICSKEDGPKGVGKLQMAAVLLAAKDAGVEFVFIQAIQGLFGVQYPLYSRFGFHAYFPQQIIARKQALDQFIDVKGSIIEKAGVPNQKIQRKTASAQASRIQYIQHPNPINWLTSSLSRSAAALTLIPMWIDARNVEEECIQNMLEIEGYNCQGDYVFERGWLGHFQRIIEYPPNKFLEKTLSRLGNLKNQEFLKIREIAASPLSSPPETFISSASIYEDA